MLIQTLFNLNFKNKYEADFLFPTVSDTVLKLERIKPPMALQIWKFINPDQKTLSIVNNPWKYFMHGPFSNQ